MSELVESPKTQFKYRLKNIDLQETSLTRLEGSISQIFHFTINLENKVNQAEKSIIVECSVQVLGEDKSKTLGTIKCAIVFEIQDFEDVVKIVDGRLVVPAELALILNHITIGTTRGAMFSTFKGTFIHFAFLPIVDMKQFHPQKLETQQKIN